MKSLEKEAEKYRAVLEGAEYQNIHRLTSLAVEQCRLIGEAAASCTKSLIAERDAATQRADAADRKLSDAVRLLHEITEDPRLVVAMKSAHLSAIRLLLSASAEAASPKCTTCSDVGVIGHSTMCPDCEPAKGDDGETSK